MKYIVMTNADPFIIVDSEKDAIECVELLVAEFEANNEQLPCIHYVKCKNASDFANNPPSIFKMLWMLFWIVLYIINAYGLLVEDSMKSGFCMIICLLMILATIKHKKMSETNE